MSEVKQWLMSIGIPGIERLADEFESRGFSTRKSLQYLQDGDLDYIFHRQPKRTICGFGLQRSFGRNILELLVYYLMPNKCKKS